MLTARVGAVGPPAHHLVEIPDRGLVTVDPRWAAALLDGYDLSLVVPSDALLAAAYAASTPAQRAALAPVVPEELADAVAALEVAGFEPVEYAAARSAR